MSAEIVLLFDTKDMNDVVGQLGKAFDDHHVAGKLIAPSLMIVNKEIWRQLEKEFQEKHTFKGMETFNTHFYKEKITTAEPGTLITEKQGYNALIFRGRPVVTIDGQNIVADRVGANG